MGWDFAQGATRADIIRERTSDREHVKCIAHATVGNALWTIREWTRTWFAGEGPGGRACEPRRTIDLDLLGASRGFGWGYKDMTEASHPYTYTCPLRFLDLAPEACAEWREAVRAYHAEKTAKRGVIRKLAVGTTVRLREGCSPAEVTIVSVKPLVGEAGGQRYRIAPRYLATA